MTANEQRMWKSEEKYRAREREREKKSRRKVGEDKIEMGGGVAEAAQQKRRD